MSAQKRSGLFSYLLILTCVFVASEIIFFVQWAQFYLGDCKTVAKHLGVPPSVLFVVLAFLGIQVSIHLLFTCIVWAVTRFIGVALILPWKKIERLGLILWSVGLITVLVANAYFFPNSKYAALIFFPQKLLAPFLIFLASLFLIAFGVAARGLFIYSRLLFAATLFLVAMIGMSSRGQVISVAERAHKPNIILIGIDSLRPDFLGYFGSEQQTPHIDDFLNHATVFADAVTPLARTFPAWISILTGQYPKHHHMRTDLENQSALNVYNTLPMILRQQGYETIFATDESRFSNIDHRLGFNQIIAPPMGFSDFLLGAMNDFPFSNLLSNTRVGGYLFPYSHANRAVFVTYDPDTFSLLLNRTITQAPHQPLFLAVHFCLPHYPYFWGRQQAGSDAVQNYRRALVRADQQVNEFLQALAANHILDHAMVVMLSDHGESIALPGDRATEADLFVPGIHNTKKIIPRFYPPSNETEAVNQSVGHGTDVLALSQYHVLLAFRLYHAGQNQTAAVPGLVSLLDIKPTVLSFLKLSKSEVDGHSLLPVIKKETTSVVAEEDFFTESDFSPQAIRSIHPEARKILFEGAEFFQFEPQTARLVVRQKMLQKILASKQYANFYHDWVLALYPQNKKEMMPILLNLKTGEWSNDLRTSFAKESPAQHMLTAMKYFYGKELTVVLNSTK